MSSTTLFHTRGAGFWFGVGALAAGLILMLDAWNVIHVWYHDIVGPLLVLIGIAIVLRAFSESRSDQRNKVIFGAALFLLGIFFILNYFGFILPPSGKGIGTFLLITGLSLVMGFIYDPSSKKLFVLALLLTALGGLIVSDILSFSFFSIVTLFSKWWPLAIIVAGVLIFLRRRKH